MHSDNSNGSHALLARGFAAFFAVLAMGIAIAARPAAAQPFAYVVNPVQVRLIVGDDCGTASVKATIIR